MAALSIKICGLATEQTIDTAIEAGADMVGLVFHPKSPRFVSLDRAAELARHARGRIETVALVVNADDDQLSAIRSTVNPDSWQFHGRETPERVRDVRAVWGLPVMKAIGIATAEDLPALGSYAGVADRLLLDAKPPQDAAYPGGHGQPFDWRVLSALPPHRPFMLSGGLTPDNVGEAIRLIRATGVNLQGVDVSSGVEAAPGIKDPARIMAFIAAVREAEGA